MNNSNSVRPIRPRDPRGDPRRISQGIIATPPSVLPQKRKASEDLNSSSSDDSKPKSILRLSLKDPREHQASRTLSERKTSIIEESGTDDIETIISKVALKLQSSSSTSVSIGLLSNFFLNYYRIHQENVMFAWHNAFLELERTSQEIYNTNLQDKILTAFYCINDAFANAYELFDRMAIDFTVFGPSAFFYAGMIGNNETITRLQKVLFIWTERRWFSDQFVKLFCNSMDEGKYFGKLCSKDNAYNEAILWTLPEFIRYFESRIDYIQSHQNKFMDKALQRPIVYEQFNSIYEDIKPLLTADSNTLAKNLTHLNQFSEQVDRLFSELKTFCNEELMLRSVIVSITTFIKFMNKTIKPLNKALLPVLKE
uniref:CID domain-containing protein n=1 Tax=Panagrolaimus superbus TaxID=310955 RepID=A0A914YYJ8_9BILA